MRTEAAIRPALIVVRDTSPKRIQPTRPWQSAPVQGFRAEVRVL